VRFRIFQQVRMKYVLPIIFFDVFLIPMNHIFGIPLKISFIFLIVYFLRHRPYSTFINPLVGMLIFLWVGKIWSYYFYDIQDFNRTIFASVNYAVIVLGLLYGLRSKPTNINWLLILILAYFCINIIILLSWRTNTFLINFYDLHSRVEENLFEVRNPGVFINPNISALGANLLILYWLIGRKFKLVTLNGHYYDAIVLLSTFLLLLTYGSKSGFSAYFLLLAYYFIAVINLKPIKVLTFSTIVVLLFIGSNRLLTSNVSFGSYSVGLNTLTNITEKYEIELDRDHSRDGSRIFKIIHGVNTWLKSPLWGLGSDRDGGKDLKQIQYHNDLIEILVSCGLVGVLLYGLLAFRISKISLALLIPFIFPGLTNSFLFSAQIAMSYFIFVGLISRGNKRENHSVAH
jgi:hypothetical protein